MISRRINRWLVRPLLALGRHFDAPGYPWRARASDTCAGYVTRLARALMLVGLALALVACGGRSYELPADGGGGGEAGAEQHSDWNQPKPASSARPCTPTVRALHGACTP